MNRYRLPHDSVESSFEYAEPLNGRRRVINPVTRYSVRPQSCVRYAAKLAGLRSQALYPYFDDCRYGEPMLIVCVQTNPGFGL